MSMQVNNTAEDGRLFRQEFVGNLVVSTIGVGFMCDQPETMIFRVEGGRINYFDLYAHRSGSEAAAIVHGGLVAAMLRMRLSIDTLKEMEERRDGDF